MKKIERAQKLISRLSAQLSCPFCGSHLVLAPTLRLVCAHRHSFDLSRKGYVNFLYKPVNTRYGKSMMEARSQMFRAGFFDPLLQEVEKQLLTYDKKDSSTLSILDAGCGEGSFLAFAIRHLNNQETYKAEGAGIDLSKEAIQMAANAYSDVVWCVGDLARIPFAPHQFDVLLNILSPANYTEFRRVLKKDGQLLKVIPGNRHLIELREALGCPKGIQAVRSEEVIQHMKKHMPVMNSIRLTYQTRLPEHRLPYLIEMTPLSWKVPQQKKDEVAKNKLNRVTADFHLLVGRQWSRSISMKKEILVFRTNLQSAEEAQTLQPLLAQLAGVYEWNTDLQDCDRILRVVSSGAGSRDIIRLVRSAGFDCCELED